MRQAIVSVGSTTRILVVSIRSVNDVTLLATQGLDAFSFSPVALFEVSATDRAARRMAFE